jgi:hypothetical protein
LFEETRIDICIWFFFGKRIAVWWSIANWSYEIKVWVIFFMFNATFNNISVISWPSVLLVEETEVPRENHRPVASHWQTLSHNLVSSTPHHEQGSNSQLFLNLSQSESRIGQADMLNLWMNQKSYLVEVLKTTKVIF